MFVVGFTAADENEDDQLRVMEASPALRSSSPRYARLGKRSAPVDDPHQHRRSKRTVPTNFRFAGLGKRRVSLAYKAAGLGKRFDGGDWESDNNNRLYAGQNVDPRQFDDVETRPEMDEKRRVSTAMRYAGLGKRQRSRDMRYMGFTRRDDRP